MARELIIYCDESDAAGKFYSDFYGGVLVKSKDLDYVKTAISKKKLALHLHGEVKWQKVTSNYLDKYKELVDLYFALTREGKLKTRIMFTQNCHVPQGLDKYHYENKYFLLYYQFIKHAFGLRYSNSSQHLLNVRLYFDKLPDTTEKSELFKDHIHGLNRYREFQKSRINIPRDQIAEVVSHDHDILQCLDIILGSIQFRLNDKHKEKPPGEYRRGKKTIAKERLYKHINNNIREIYPNFNIGISTGVHGKTSNRWQHPYRHWLFIPSSVKLDLNKTKGK